MKQFPVTDLTDQRQKAVDAFKKALKRRDEGKPDGDGGEVMNNQFLEINALSDFLLKKVF